MTIAPDVARPWTADAAPSFTTLIGEVIPAVACAEMRADRFVALAGERLATVVAAFPITGEPRVPS